MGTTSQKLEYLNDTKNSLKSAINNLGGAIDSNTTFRAYASELDTIYDNLPKVSDTGTNVSLSPTLKGRLGIVPKGNTYQESTTGKNLLPNSTTSQIINGITFTRNTDGSVIANGTATANTFFNCGETTLSAGTYNLSSTTTCLSNAYLQLIEVVTGNPVITYLNNQSNSSFTTTEEKNIRVFFRIGNGVTLSNMIVYPMIETGSSMTSYEPYTNGASPNPDYPQEIQSATGTQKVVVSGKNLANINEIEKTNNATIELNDNGFTYTRIAASSGDLFVATLSKQLKPNTTYSTYMTKDTSNFLYFYADKLFGNSLQRNQIAYTAEYIAYTFTTDSTGYVVIGFYSTNSSQGGTGTIGNIVLTEGVKTIEELQKYQPYIEPQEVDIELSSKNLFDKEGSTLVSKIINGSTRWGYEFSVDEDFYISNTPHNHNFYLYKEENETLTLIDVIPTTPAKITNTNEKYFIALTSTSNKDIAISHYADENFMVSYENIAYTPYYNYTPNKIGDYEDYIDGTPDNWVLYKKTREISLNISDMNNNEDYPGWKNVANLNADYADVNTTLNAITNFKANITKEADSGVSINTKGVNSTLYLRLYIFNLTQTQWKEQYPNLTFKLVYGLQEYEQTSITDENLISQLNELYYLQSYNDTTNVDVTGNLPMRITASAIKGE